MTMFVWRSKVLEAYSSGYIIVEAETVEEARDKARACYKDKWLVTDEFWLDDDDKAEKIKKFDQDLAEEPEIFSVLLIRGSE